ncbi:MAG: hypothetical protein QOE22_551 [Candidatus Parcubacteria bacterium]|jgi:glycosyltransferase involved in cell wall biosynthesis|nr:hypothetical protein [Candidatus Parcubacteria bacterium]
MRLLIATPLYPPEPGGPATYAKLLEEGLPALGVDVSVVKFGDVRHLPKLVRHFAYMRRLVRKGRSADVILVLDPVSTGFPAALAALFLRKRLVLRVGGDYAWEQGKQRFGITQSLDDFVRTGRVPLPVAILRSVESWVAHRARLVITPSEYLKGIVATWGIPAGKIAVVHNSVAPTEGGAVPEHVRELPHPRVVTVARLVPWKGVDGLIDAVAEARSTGKAVSLVIVGEGPERARLEAHAREKLEGGTVFTGALSPENVHAMLRESDIFVLNSTYEGLSHVLIEALMAGVPVVATRAGGNGEVLTEDSGILIPVGDTPALADAIGKIARDPELRARLRKGALERAGAFSVPVMLARTQELLSKLV